MAGDVKMIEITDFTTGNVTPADLAESLVAEDEKIKIIPETVQFTGADKAGGAFSGGSDIIGIENGIILSSGQVIDVKDRNEEPNRTTAFFNSGDDDLSALVDGRDTFDAAILEFDFEAPENAKGVRFDYVFGSEEYNEYIGWSYNDVFAFWINGINCAVVDNPEDTNKTLPVSVNTINNGKPGREPKNPELYINNDPSQPDSTGETVSEDELAETTMDGFTIVLSCEGEIEPDTTNTMRLAIADTSDYIYDSWVFIAAKSLETIPDPNIKPEPEPEPTPKPTEKEKKNREDKMEVEKYSK
jgi:hypothetical protein